ncbi:hypothetical protein [Streptomyces sp. NPDC058665]|uniref:hypothetical protein n=1 Tax=Streptomyces sp. NPDC058665 TaxID=3346586 RepID=UPI003649A468
MRDAQEPVRVREVTEASFGQRANRSLQKGVRRQVERLVHQGRLTSADSRGFSAVR